MAKCRRSVYSFSARFGIHLLFSICRAAPRRRTAPHAGSAPAAATTTGSSAATDASTGAAGTPIAAALECAAVYQPSCAAGTSAGLVQQAPEPDAAAAGKRSAQGTRIQQTSVGPAAAAHQSDAYSGHRSSAAAPEDAAAERDVRAPDSGAEGWSSRRIAGLPSDAG
jgi:hypothetical protein